MRWWLVPIALAGCFGSTQTPFDEGVAPLEEMAVDAPEDLAERFNLRVEEGDEHIWGHLRGYIHADLNTVWDAFKDDEVAVNRRRVASWTAELDVEPEYDFSMAIDQVVEDTITIEYTIVWRHGAAGGTAQDPQKVSMRWQKTDGTSLIDKLAGSVALLPTDDPNITEVQMVEHLKAPLTGTEDVEGLLVDVFNDALLHAKGEPLPDLSDED
ncbi:MAG: hypothetical protein AB8H79_26160 [Myxococcota bacterium]